MKEMGWDQAIKVVLKSSKIPLHYKEIAEEIQKAGLRTKLGATPASTVASYISTSISNDPKTDFIRTSPGYCTLKSLQIKINKDSSVSNDSILSDEVKPTGLIQSFGMYWRASEVVWKSNPRLLGQQQIGSDQINFSNQVGVYVLYDRDRVIYVGRTTDRAIGQRLFEHTKGRMNGRWDRFSWFGLKGVDEKGDLVAADFNLNGENILIETLEAILIETLEPPQNRKRGDQFSATEYLQIQDPETSSEKTAKAALLSLLKDMP